jgi:PAS domain S-box-containing protein
MNRRAAVAALESCEARGAVHGALRHHWRTHRGEFAGSVLPSMTSESDERGQQTGITGARTAITQDKAALEALRLTEERYALAMDASEEGHFDWNLETDLLFTSAKLSALFGLPAEAKHAHRREFVVHIPYPPGEREAVHARLDAVLKGSAVRHEFEHRIVAQSGEIHWLRARWKIQRDQRGRAIRVVGVVTDVTALKLAERELRARQQMLEVAQQAAGAVPFEWSHHVDPAQNRWPHGLDALFGMLAGSFEGTLTGQPNRVHPDDWPAVEAAIARAPESGGIDIEYRVLHEGGHVHWLHQRGRTFMGDGTSVARSVGFMLDVTERHHSAEVVRSLERQLRQAQHFKAIGAFASGIAHDFNNILSAILGFGERASRDAPAGSRLRRDLESLTIAGERGRALVGRILTFSRSGTGKRVPVHVEGIVREALHQLAVTLPPGIRVHSELGASRATVLADPTQVHQVIMNLATNAVQSIASAGTVAVTLDCVHFDEARVVTAGALVPGDYLELKVIDAGSGIPAEILERIFDPLFTTKEVGVGTGLGLSLVHGIVTELGGAIDVVSTPGAGSAFTVFLPRAGEQ